MYALIKEVNALENAYSHLDFSKPDVWLEDAKLVEDFFSVWKQLLEHYRYTGDMFIHPLVILIYQRFNNDLHTLIESKNLSENLLEKAKIHRERLNAYFDLILEETTFHANQLLHVDEVKHEVKSYHSDKSFQRRGFNKHDFFED